VGVYSGVEKTWATQTDTGRTHIATKGVNQSGLVLNLDASSFSGIGTIWTDLSGNANNATLINGTSYTRSNGGSLSFDGSNDRITIANPLLSSTGDWTISSNINFTTLTGNISNETAANIFSQYINTTGNGRIVFRVKNNTTSTINKLELFLGSGSDYSNQSIVGVTSIFTNRVYNFVATKSSSTYNLYINSVLETSQTLAGVNVSILQTTPEIGGLDSGNFGFINGNVFTTQVYNRALSPLEIQRNYLAFRSRFENGSRSSNVTIISSAGDTITNQELTSGAGVLRVSTEINSTVVLNFSSTATGSTNFSKTVIASSTIQGVVLTSTETSYLRGSASLDGTYTVLITATVDGVPISPLTFTYVPDPTEIIGQLSITELTAGNETGPIPSTFRISRTGVTTNSVNVRYSISGTATGGVDYTYPTGYDVVNNIGITTIGIGQTFVDLVIPTIDNNTADGLRRVLVTLQATSGYTLGVLNYDFADLTDNDGALVPVLSVAKITYAEGNSGTKTGSFILKLSQATTVQTSFSYAFRAGTATVGVGSDYNPTTSSGTSIIPDTATQITLSFTIYGDTNVEDNETLFLDLSNPNGLTFANGQSTYTITAVIANDDFSDPNQGITITSDGDIFGSPLNDILTGDSGVNLIDSLEGDDTLTGGLGADLLFSGTGADRYVYNSFDESCLAFGTDFTDASFTSGDRIVLPFIPTALWNVGIVTAASLTQAFEISKSDKDLLTSDAQPLSPNEAIMFTWGLTSRGRRTYVGVTTNNDDITRDFLIVTPSVSNTIGSLNVLNFFA
jgi:hypothetical protein